jgi:dihydrofolate synthase/folylpolyglutamate synthase
MTDLTRVLLKLYERVPLGMRLGLDAMNAACTRFGHPERACEVVHVAGTNGKGSVCAMTESMLREAGLRTGLYTSPHLCRFAERIQVNGKPVDDATLVRHLDDVLGREPDLSFFEAATLTAMLIFREAKCDHAILEVGLGGRLDATNVIATPRVAAITRIDLDHTDRLGPTVEAIASEKAGIMKPGGRVVVGPATPSVSRVLEQAAREVGATLVNGVDEVAMREVTALALGLQGEHQRTNAAMAWTIGAELGIADSARRRGLVNVRWSGRCEQLYKDGVSFLLDGAHNPDGALALAAFVRATHPNPHEVALIFGALADKDWQTVLGTLAPCAVHRTYVAPVGRAAAPPDALAARWPGTAATSISEALRLAARQAPHVLVAGSLHLVGEARAELLGLRRDPPVAL